MPGSSWGTTFSGGRCQANVTAATSEVGARPASNASANTLGTYTDVLASGFTNDVDGFYLQLQQTGVGVTAFDALCDLAIGAGGSEKVILSKMICCNGGTAVANGSYIWWPIPIKAGVRVAARLQDTSGANVVDFALIGISNGFLAPSHEGTAVTYGASAATSKGVSIDPGGSANTKGSWVEITSATSQYHRYLTVGVGNLANAGQSASTTLIDIGIGSAGNEVVLIPNIACRTLVATTGLGMITPNMIGPFPVELPEGTRLSVRGQCSSTDSTDRKFSSALYGVG